MADDGLGQGADSSPHRGRGRPWGDVTTGPSVAADTEPGTVFDDQIREDIRRRYGEMHPTLQPRLVHTALDPAAGRLRGWLDAEVLRIDAGKARHVLGQLRGPDSHSAALAELATLSALRDGAGLEVVLDPHLGNQTPDLAALDPPSGRPVLVAEVWSRSITPEVRAEQRGWVDLARAVATIRAAVRLTATPVNPPRSGPPGPNERAEIVAHLRKYGA